MFMMAETFVQCYERVFCIIIVVWTWVARFPNNQRLMLATFAHFLHNVNPSDRRIFHTLFHFLAIELFDRMRMCWTEILRTSALVERFEVAQCWKSWRNKCLVQQRLCDPCSRRGMSQHRNSLGSFTVRK